jgi:hypothetical protein
LRHSKLQVVSISFGSCPKVIFCDSLLGDDKLVGLTARPYRGTGVVARYSAPSCIRDRRFNEGARINFPVVDRPKANYHPTILSAFFSAVFPNF